MNCQRVKVYFIIVTAFVCAPCACATIKTHQIQSDGRVERSPKGLNTFVRTTETRIYDPLMVLSKLEGEHKHENFLSFSQNPGAYEGTQSLSLRERIRVRQVEQISDDKEKLSAIKNAGNDMDAKTLVKKKKAKALGHLLLNRISHKSNDDQDDYMEDEDDDYSYDTNREKMNWQSYQNEDGASIMELIALNMRHKARIQRARDEQFPYEK